MTTESILEKTKKILELIGYYGFEISSDESSRRISILIPDSAGLQKDLPKFLPALERVINLMAKKEGRDELIMIDINNYRRERERLITELAKAAAHKVLIDKAVVELPPMNSYERRLVHLEIAHKPDLITESVGEGPQRRVVVKPLES